MLMNDSIDEQFERFWKGFDPNFRYSDRTKEFVRKVWEIVRDLNFRANNQ